MKKRLRKKKRIGEFQEFGFKAGFRFSPELDNNSRDELIIKFIEEAIEDNGLQIGGGGTGIEWSGFITSEKPRESTSNQHRKSVKQWILQQPEILEYYVSRMIDAWHGDFNNLEIEWVNK